MAKSSESQIPWAVLITMALTIGGGLTLISPLKSARPSGDLKPIPGLAQQDVSTRLWQDPLRVVFDQAKDTGGVDRSRLEGLRERIRRVMAESRTGERVLVLPVMVSGASYPEVTERRMRTRFAVLSALARCGYASEDTDHIGYVALPWPNDPLPSPLDAMLNSKPVLRWPDAPATVKPVADPSLTTPYEWLSQSATRMPLTLPATRYTKVLVLWLNEDVFGVRPCARLQRALHSLFNDILLPMSRGPYKEAWATLSVGRAVVDVHVIGPSNSTTLRAMAEELNSARYTLWPVPLTNVSFFCGNATAESAAITHQLYLGPVRQDLRDLFKTQGHISGPGTPCQFIRTTLDDRDVCHALLRELELRQIDLKREGDQTVKASPDDEVALISEWDTYYGRVLPTSFMAAMAGRSVADMEISASTGKDGPSSAGASTVHTFWYLRGIDGQVSVPERSGEKKIESKTASQERPEERPEGTDQTDYLRRLADRLAALDSALTAKGKRLNAVGILGTDVYDKLLILRAVRDRLPRVVCFTTGLDARYSLPSEFTAVRNLIIASPFGSQASSYYQGGIAPFRDAYQTASFYATLTSLGAIPKSTFDRENVATTRDKSTPALGPPHVFEVGRFGPVDLTPDDATSLSNRSEMLNDSTTAKSLQFPRENTAGFWVDRQRQGLQRRSIAFVCLGFIAMGLILTLFIHGTFGSLKEEAKRFAPLIGFLLFAAVGAGCFAYHYWADGAEGQLISLDGSSVWPTEILRLIVVLLGPALIVVSYYVAKRTDGSLQRQFNLKSLDEWEKLCGPGDDAAKIKRDKSFPSFKFRLGNWKVFAPAQSPPPLVCSANYKTHPGPADKPSQVYAQNVWWEYQARQRLWCRVGRTVLATACYAAAAYLIIQIFGEPFNAIRGVHTARLDKVMTVAVVFIPLLVYFYILDASLLNCQLINHLNRATTSWPVGGDQAVLGSLQGKMAASFRYQDLTEFLDIQFIARRTRVVGRSIYIPFVVLGLLLLSRSTVFYNWAWPPGMVIVFIGNTVLALLGALMLRRAAEHARRRALEALRDRRTYYLMLTEPDATLQTSDKGGYDAKIKEFNTRKDYAAAVEKLEQMVQDERRGAFSILSQYPALGAILLPSSGIGFTAIFEYLFDWLR